jgi:hypothetical protein
MNALSASFNGIRVAEDRFGRAASRVAGGALPGSDVDVGSEMVIMRLAKAQLEASAAVTRTVSETLGTLVNLVV